MGSLVMGTLPTFSIVHSNKFQGDISLMCREKFNENLAPLTIADLAFVQRTFPEQSTFAKQVYDALVKDLTPQKILLVALTIMKKLYDEGFNGIFHEFGKIIYGPLSIVAKTGSHEWTRFRPQIVTELHEAFLPFMMASPNRQKLQLVMASYGLALDTLHCCGVVIGEVGAVQNLLDSPLAAKRNRMRSYAETMAMPVAKVPFEKVPAQTSDLGLTERYFYKLLEDTLGVMLQLGYDFYINHSMEEIWDAIVLSNPVFVNTL